MCRTVRHCRVSSVRGIATAMQGSREEPPPLSPPSPAPVSFILRHNDKVINQHAYQFRTFSFKTPRTLALRLVWRVAGRGRCPSYLSMKKKNAEMISQGSAAAAHVVERPAAVGFHAHKESQLRLCSELLHQRVPLVEQLVRLSTPAKTNTRAAHTGTNTDMPK